MKKILALLLLLPSVAFGQGWQIGNPVGTPRALPTPGTVMTKANVDVYGNQQVVSVGGGGSGLSQSVIPVSNATNLNGVGAMGVGTVLVGLDVIEAASTTTVLNLTAHAAAAGDVIRFPSVSQVPPVTRQWSSVCSTTTNTVTLCNALGFTPTAGQDVAILRPSPLGAQGNSSTGETSLSVNINSNAYAGSTSILKLEDSAAASSDALVGLAGVSNEAGTALAADGDYTVLATTRKGYGQSIPVYDSNVGRGIRAITAEDETSADAEAINKMGILREDALTLNTGASADWTPPKADALGRTITTLAPAGESWYSCSGAIGTATNTSLKAAVASNRIYVTAYGCTNNGATANLIGLTDGLGGTSMDITLLPVATSAGPFYWKTFPVPLRGTSNTALGITTGAASNTYCCASGYISVN